MRMDYIPFYFIYLLIFVLLIFFGMKNKHKLFFISLIIFILILIFKDLLIKFYLDYLFYPIYNVLNPRDI